MSQLIIVSGPSGVGKNTLVDAVLELHPEMGYFKKITTRDRRPDDRTEEADFVSLDQYSGLLSQFRIALPYTVRGKQYGLPVDSFANLKANPQVVCLSDFKLIESLQHGFNTITVYVTASPDKIIQRLQQRPDTEEQRQSSIDSVARHLEDYQQHKRLFDYEIVNDEFEVARTKLRRIVLDEVSPERFLYSFLLPKSTSGDWSAQCELQAEGAHSILLPSAAEIKARLETRISQFYCGTGIFPRELSYLDGSVGITFYIKRDRERKDIDFGYFELQGPKRSIAKTKAVLEELFPQLGEVCSSFLFLMRI